MGVVAAGVVDAFAIETNWLDVSIHDVPVAALPASLEGFTVAQVTDAHLRRMGTVEAAIVRTLEELDVQLLVLTGDIIDSRRYMPVLRDFCGVLRRPGMTSIATLGNWEHWGGIADSDLAATYSDIGVELLVNASLRSDGLRVIATDDSTAGEPRLDVLRDAASDPTLLLTHSPALLDRVESATPRPSLALAGHTHGGQVRLSSLLVPFVPGGSGRFVAGWYDYPGGRAYVSRGTGTSIAPARFTCRPELPIFRLLRA